MPLVICFNFCVALQQSGLHDLLGPFHLNYMILLQS